MPDSNDQFHHPLIPAEEVTKLKESINIHRFNEKAIRHTKSLGDLVGLSKFGIHLVRIAPGDETTQYHVHQLEEEFIYILSGRGVSDIGDERFEVGPGDFMGFRAGHLPHTMFNPFKADLVYLMGGNRFSQDICDYPRIKRRLYRIEGQREYVRWDDIHFISPGLSEKKA